MDYKAMSDIEREEFHRFEERRHKEAKEHLELARRLSDMGIAVQPFSAAAEKVNDILYDDYLIVKKLIGTQPLFSVDIEALKAEVANATIEVTP